MYLRLGLGLPYLSTRIRGILRAEEEKEKECWCLGAGDDRDVLAPRPGRTGPFITLYGVNSPIQSAVVESMLIRKSCMTTEFRASSYVEQTTWRISDGFCAPNRLSQPGFRRGYSLRQSWSRRKMPLATGRKDSIPCISMKRSTAGTRLQLNWALGWHQQSGLLKIYISMTPLLQYGRSNSLDGDGGHHNT